MLILKVLTALARIMIRPSYLKLPYVCKILTARLYGKGWEKKKE